MGNLKHLHLSKQSYNAFMNNEFNNEFEGRTFSTVI